MTSNENHDPGDEDRSRSMEGDCPRCDRPIDMGRAQWNCEVWCFDCSMHPHDVRTRMKKQNGTFVPPRGPLRIVFTDKGER